MQLTVSHVCSEQEGSRTPDHRVPTSSQPLLLRRWVCNDTSMHHNIKACLLLGSWNYGRARLVFLWHGRRSMPHCCRHSSTAQLLQSCAHLVHIQFVEHVLQHLVVVDVFIPASTKPGQGQDLQQHARWRVLLVLLLVLLLLLLRTHSWR